MEDKRITHTARLVLRLWNTGLFALVWFKFYNAFVFDTYLLLGGFFSVVIFYVIYTWFCNIYKAFRIASTDVTEIVFSQFISFAFADVILYVECILIHNLYVSIIPGLVIVLLQVAGTMIFVLSFKRYFMRHVAPQKTVVIYGKETTREEALSFEKRLLLKYAHLFDILFTEQEDLNEDYFQQCLQGCDTVILYNVGTGLRAKYTKESLNLKKNIYFTPDIEDVLHLGCEPKHLLDTPLMKYEYIYENSRKRVAKRTLDVIFSIIAIIIASPIMIAVAIAIKAEDGGPVLYRQRRYTIGGREFEIYKFRSMVVDAEKDGILPSTKGDSRITKVGGIIRKMRIDEIPQFINILKGDMSFVGPRPERMELVALYMHELPEFRYRMSVKGGLTGYAQVFGKYNTTAYDKLLLDLMYIENQSILLDFKIMLLTIRTVFQKESTEGFDPEVSAGIQRETSEGRERP